MEPYHWSRSNLRYYPLWASVKDYKARSILGMLHPHEKIWNEFHQPLWNKNKEEGIGFMKYKQDEGQSSLGIELLDEKWANIEANIISEDEEKNQELLKKIEIRDALLGKKDNMYLDFEGGLKMRLDSGKGLLVHTSGGIYAFGRDWFGIFGSQFQKEEDVNLWYWDNERNEWGAITKKNMEQMSSGNKKDWLWELYNSFLECMDSKNAEKCGMLVEIEGEEPVSYTHLTLPTN